MSLTQDEIRALLEAKNPNGTLVNQDVLTPEILKEDAFFRARSCPSCFGSATRSFVDPKRPFVPGNPLSNKLLQCLQCEAEFNPYTGLITRMPTAALGLSSPQ